MAQMGAWSRLPSAHSGLARACLSGKRCLVRRWYLVSSYGQKWMPGERVHEPVSAWFPRIQWVSLPWSWSVYHPSGCSFLQWLAEAKRSQAVASVWCHPLLQRGLLCSAAPTALQSTNDITFGNETYWWFSHNGYFGKFFFCTVRMERVTNATVVLGTQSALLCFETDVPRFYRAFTHRLCSRLHTFLKFVRSEQFMPSLKKKKSPKIGQLKAFWQCLTTWATQM